MLGILGENDIKNIDINNINDLIGCIELIDVREGYEYKMSSIKTAKNVPLFELLIDPENYLNKDMEYYIMCQSGGRSERACELLLSRGFKVINVLGGIGEYRGNKRE